MPASPVVPVERLQQHQTGPLGSLGALTSTPPTPTSPVASPAAVDPLNSPKSPCSLQSIGGHQQQDEAAQQLQPPLGGASKAKPSTELEQEKPHFDMFAAHTHHQMITDAKLGDVGYAYYEKTCVVCKQVCAAIRGLDYTVYRVLRTPFPTENASSCDVRAREADKKRKYCPDDELVCANCFTGANAQQKRSTRMRMRKR